MRDFIGFSLRGADELTAKMRRVGPEIATKGGAVAVRAGAKFLVGKIVENTPVGDADTTRKYTVNGGKETRTVDYGHLRDNIKLKKGKARKEYNQVHLVGTGSGFWGYFLEFGTEKMAPRLFMKPAIEANSQGALDVVTQQLGRYLDRAIKKMGG